MSLGGKTLGAHVRHPDLQRAQAPLPHAPSVLADPFSHRHGNMLHVTPTPYLRDLGTTLVIVDEVHNLSTDNPAGAQAASSTESPQRTSTPPFLLHRK